MNSALGGARNRRTCAEIFYRGGAKRRPTMLLLFGLLGQREWSRDQFRTQVLGVIKPLVHKIAQSDPGLFPREISWKVAAIVCRRSERFIISPHGLTPFHAHVGMVPHGVRGRGLYWLFEISVPIKSANVRYSDLHFLLHFKGKVQQAAFCLLVFERIFEVASTAQTGTRAVGGRNLRGAR